MKKGVTLAMAAVLAACVGPASQSVAQPAAQFTEAQIWELLEPGCNALGIDPEPCRCVMDGMIAAHGLDASAAVALEIVLREDEASALKDQLGEDAVFAASDTFDQLQNTQCTPGASAGGSQAGSAASGAAVGTTLDAAESPQ